MPSVEWTTVDGIMRTSILSLKQTLNLIYYYKLDSWHSFVTLHILISYLYLGLR